METKIISAFPGTGKSYFAAHHTGSGLIMDLDSNEFTQGYDKNGKARSQEFPLNYIRAIKDKIGTVDFLLISCQDEVISGLVDDGLAVTVVYPEKNLANEYKERFKLRGSDQSFIELVIKNWDGFIDQLQHQDKCHHIVLKKYEYLSDIAEATGTEKHP